MSVNLWNEMMQPAITEVQARIRAVYPEATFRLAEGEDPIGQPFQYDHLCARSFAVETCLPF
jgi:hypothetical protein